MNVGIKELRNHLSRHLTEVQEGTIITVTDHGTPIAQIIPLDRSNLLGQLILEGKVQPAQPGKRKVPKPVKANGTVSDLVVEQRR